MSKSQGQEAQAKPTPIQVLAAFTAGALFHEAGDPDTGDAVFASVGLDDKAHTDPRSLLILAYQLQDQGLLLSSVKLPELMGDGTYEEDTQTP